MTSSQVRTRSSPRLPALRRADLDPQDTALFDEVAISRGGMPTSFRVFLNSPGATRAIADFGKYVRWGSHLSDRTIEIVCLRVAAVLDDSFMWSHHTVLAANAGLSPREIALLREPSTSEWPEGDLRDLVPFIDAELRCAMTDPVFDVVARSLGAAATVELALATAYYTMHHILFSTLRLESGTDTRVPLERESVEMPGETK